MTARTVDTLQFRRMYAPILGRESGVLDTDNLYVVMTLGHRYAGMYNTYRLVRYDNSRPMEAAREKMREMAEGCEVVSFRLVYAASRKEAEALTGLRFTMDY